MFFYPTVLNHRTGRFSTIWLAATKGRKITRRDFLNVNVYRTCLDIMDFVLVRVPPPMAGLPRPRFSLYLSSQLQYGVVLVFHRQCEFLLADTQGAIDRLLRFNRVANIDLLVEESRQSHMIPDAATLFDESEGARDPFFGVMEYSLPSPSSFLERLEEPSPEHVLPAREPTPPSDGITASQESITLPEREPVGMPEPEFEGADLLESNMIELLLEQPDHFLERDDERQMETDRAQTEAEEDRELRMPDEREQERAAVEREPARELTISASLDLAQTTGQEAVLLPEEDLGLPMEMPVLEEREQTPVSGSVPIPFPLAVEEEEVGVEVERERMARERSPRLEPAAPSPERPEGKRKMRRQLLFADERTQIPQERMRAQINNVKTMNKPLASVIKQPEVRAVKNVKQLLNSPCMDLPIEILALWKQAAVVRPIPSSVRPWELPEAEEIPEREEERPEPPEMAEEERELSPREASVIEPPEMRAMKSAKQLRKNPCMDLPPEILALWKQAAVVRPIPSSVRPWELPEAEEIPEREERPEPPEMEKEERELSPREIPREMVESEIFEQETPASLVVLETTDKEFSPLETPEMRRSPVPELQFGLEDIPEVGDITTAAEEQIRPQDVPEDLVTFHSLLPRQPRRRVVAHMFWRLLEETVAGTITLRQDMPYGDIIISQS